MTELLWAAKRGDLATLDAELAAGATLFDVSTFDSFEMPKGWNALVFAAHSRGCSDAAFEGILARTCAAGAFDPRRAATALHEAARQGAVQKVRALLDAGADPGVRTLMGSHVLDSMPYFRTAEQRACLAALLDANGARGGGAESGPRLPVFLCRQALGRGNRASLALLVQHAGDAFEAPLAEQIGALGARLVLGHGLGHLAGITAEDATQALWTAVWLDDIEAARALVAHGADLTTHDSLGTPLLSHAAAADADRVARWLLEQGADPNEAGYAGWTPLHDAVGHGAARTTRLLLEAGARLEYIDPEGETCSVIPAAVDGAIDVLYEYGADLDTLDSGDCLLQIAATNGDIALVRRLLAYGVDVDRHEALIEQSALHAAVSYEEAEIALLLLEHGADPNMEDLDGWRPLDKARSRFLKAALQERGAEGGFWTRNPRPEDPPYEVALDGELGEWLQAHGDSLRAQLESPWARWDGRGEPPPY